MCNIQLHYRWLNSLLMGTSAICCGFFSNRICCHPSEKSEGETACWGHCFNDFIGVLLLLPLTEWTSFETCIGKNCKLGFFLLKKCCQWFEFYSTCQRWSQGHKARGQGHKKILCLEQTLFRPRPDLLEAKDQGHRRKCSPKKRSSK